LWQAGKDLVVGLWNGIESAVGWLSGKVSGFVSNLMGTITNGLGIHSPSTITLGHGRMLVLGLASGIDAEASTAVASASRLALRVAAAADPGRLVVTANPATTPGGWATGNVYGVAGTAGATVVTNVFHIAGTVVAERQLLELVRAGTQRYARRNLSTGLTTIGR
jgi:hypothetical protein